MTDDGLDEARKDLAKIRASLETTLAALEFVPEKPGVCDKDIRARALDEVKKTLESVDVLAQTMGGIPAPVRH